MIEVMLTTVDNPYNPFEQFDQWYAYDISAGYYTSGFLARIANVSNELSDADYNAALDAAINEIVKENVLGLYRKVTREVKDKTEEE